MRSYAPIVCAIALVILAGRALAAGDTTPAAKPPAADTASAFDLTDRNHNSSVDREEFMSRQVDVFYFEDANKDGFLVVTEIDDVDPARFKAADVDHDGKLSLQEYLNARSKDFDTADQNHDGGLTSSETSSK
jgi:hypothetical protein